jgi:hypothetical protein
VDYTQEYWKVLKENMRNEKEAQKKAEKKEAAKKRPVSSKKAA